MDRRLLRAGWLTPWYPWAGDQISGVFHRTQARALARHDVSVTVVAPRPMVPPGLAALRPRWARYAAMPRFEVDGQVEIRRPAYPAIPGEPRWARPSWAVARAAMADMREAGPPDIIHGHFVVPTGMAARRIAHQLGRPYLVTIHGYDATSWPAAHGNSLGEYRATLADASAVVTVSHALANRIGELTGVTAITLPLGIDIRSFRRGRMPRLDARRMLGLPADRPIVLFAARNVRHKGLVEFVEAILALGPPVLALVLGDGPLRGHREAEGRRQDAFRYLGPQDATGVALHMSAADVLVLPSYQEGLPTVLVEAGSLGLPIIASNVDGTPELLADDRGILIPPRDPDAIVEAIRGVIADPGAAADRAERLRSHVEHAYDVDANAGALLDLYRDIVSRGDAR